MDLITGLKEISTEAVKHCKQLYTNKTLVDRFKDQVGRKIDLREQKNWKKLGKNSKKLEFFLSP